MHSNQVTLDLVNVKFQIPHHLQVQLPLTKYSYYRIVVQGIILLAEQWFVTDEVAVSLVIENSDSPTSSTIPRLLIEEEIPLAE